MNLMDVTLENCLSSQLPSAELINEGSLERVAQKHQKSEIITKKRETKIYRTQIILSATLMALSQIWRLQR
jgi:hypothetical protein